MCPKEKESLAETLVNLQAMRADITKCRNRSFVLMLDILYFNTDPSITQCSAIETAKLPILEVSNNETSLLAQKPLFTPD